MLTRGILTRGGRKSSRFRKGDFSREVQVDKAVGRRKLSHVVQERPKLCWLREFSHGVQDVEVVLRGKFGTWLKRSKVS